MSFFTDEEAGSKWGSDLSRVVQFRFVWEDGGFPGSDLDTSTSVPIVGQVS